MKTVSHAFSGWRYLKIGALTVLTVLALGAIAVGYEMSYAEAVMRDAARELNRGRPSGGTRVLEQLGARMSFKLFRKFGMMNDEEFMRLRCAALVLDREYEKGADVCALAQKSARDPRIKHEALFNHASAMIPLAMSGGAPKGLSRAIDDLKQLLRDDRQAMTLLPEEHARAALILEKLNLVKAGEGKGKPQAGEEGGRPDVQMFDEAPGTGNGSGFPDGY